MRPAYLERLRYRWPYILEDEAQDSSRLQEQILRLAGQRTATGCAWATPTRPFTRPSPPPTRATCANFSAARTCAAARAAQLRALDAQDHRPGQLPGGVDDGRAPACPRLREALQAPPVYQPHREGDPQPNPPDDPAGIYLVERKFTPQEEIESGGRFAGALAARALPTGPWRCWRRATTRGFEMVDELRRRGIASRGQPAALVAGHALTRPACLGTVLRYLADPGSAAQAGDASTKSGGAPTGKSARHSEGE